MCYYSVSLKIWNVMIFYLYNELESKVQFKDSEVRS